MARYTPHTDVEIQTMLQEIGLDSVESLFNKQIPEALRLNRSLNLPEGKSEMEVERLIRGFGKKNNVFGTIFRGAGAYDHYIPGSVKHLASRTEFLSAYTPYQAEISQGLLQIIFEFQTMMCELTGLDVSNASIYDGATAAAEACKMALDKKRKEVLVASTVNPETLQVLRTYLEPLNVDLKLIPAKGGTVDLSSLSTMITEQTACVYVDQLNFEGVIEDLTAIHQLRQGTKTLLVAGINPIAAALLPSAGECGVDIAVGEAQPLGLPLSFGGPYLGFMTAKAELVRKLPGRIVGETVDTRGQRSFVLTLQAREQHIKREKSLSSICSNQAHCALLSTVYLSTVGGEGLRQVAELCLSKAHYLAEKLTAVKGVSLKNGGEFFHEFVTVLDRPIASALLSCLETHDILGGLPLSETEILWCATEKVSSEEIDTLVSLVNEFMNA